jgi:hypothetical protein
MSVLKTIYFNLAEISYITHSQRLITFSTMAVLLLAVLTAAMSFS